MAPSPIAAPPNILSLLKTLHETSRLQESQITTPWPPRGTPEFDALMLDKFIAIDADKAEFIYNLLRATNATTVVEAGTSFGVSTIYLALAVAQNAAGSGVTGKVIATEKEPKKADKAREHWAMAGDEVYDVIDLRVGDLRETLKSDLGVVDFLLLDIWTPLALPALKLVQPSMRRGAVIIADNTVMAHADYTEFREYVKNPDNGFRRMVLPFTGGLDMIIYDPQN